MESTEVGRPSAPTRLVSGGDDCRVRLWDLETGRQLRTMKGHGAAVDRCAVSPDRTRALTLACSGERTARLWLLETGEQLGTWKARPGNLLDAAFLPDGTPVVLLERGGTVELWDAVGGRQLGSFGHPDEPGPVAAALSVDGSRLVAGGTSVHAWDVASGALLEAWPVDRFGTGGGPKARAFGVSADGRIVAAAGWMGVRAWTMPGGVPALEPVFEPVLAPDGGEPSFRRETVEDIAIVAPATACDVSADGSRLAVVGGGGQLEVWDLASGRRVFDATGDYEPAFDSARSWPFYDCGLAPDGRLVAAANRDGKVHVWDLGAGIGSRALPHGITPNAIHAALSCAFA